jgi:hypothetical protein
MSPQNDTAMESCNGSLLAWTPPSRESTAPIGMLQTLVDLTNSIAFLHLQLSRDHLNPFISEAAFFEKLGGCVDSDTAAGITQALLGHVRFDPALIAAIDVFVIYPFDNDQISWPVVCWKEFGGREAAAIFDMQDVEDMGEGRENSDQGVESLYGDESSNCNDKPGWQNESSNYMIHYGIRETLSTESRWRRSALVWNVNAMHSLKALFYAGHHGAGILTLPPDVAERVYCHHSTSLDNSQGFETRHQEIETER